jgi:hypothetical protein
MMKCDILTVDVNKYAKQVTIPYLTEIKIIIAKCNITVSRMP